MKRTKWIGLFCTTGLLASCAGTSDDEQHKNLNEEITFAVAPATKSSSIFENSNVFQTTAFYNYGNEPWNNNFLKSQKYIVEETVRAEHGIWKGEHLCSWPNDGGGLTFFSWSTNKDKLDIKGNCSLFVSNETGITLSGFDISRNPDIDFLVADIAENLHKKSQVITKFNHQLSKIKMSLTTVDDYSDAKEIIVDSIIVRNIAKTASYQQCEVISDKLVEVRKWTVYETYNLKIGRLAVNQMSRFSVIPQSFKGNELIEIHYTIRDLYSDIFEHIKEVRTLDSVIGSEFKAGTVYSVEIKIGLDQIFYDPYVGDWSTD